MRVYAIDDFQRQLMFSLQQENEQLTARLAQLTEENRVLNVLRGDLIMQTHRNDPEVQALLNLLVPPDEVVSSKP